jgi:ABC-type uncharacterized transport system substrate-binding protein
MTYYLIRLIVALTFASPVAPLTAEAQQGRQVWRVGLLSTATARSGPQFIAFVQRLRELGYVEGYNFTFEFRDAEAQAERLADLAAELVRLPVDILIAGGPEATLRAARDATSTIPIVMVAVNYDPIAQEYIASLARPGGNITGVFFNQVELTAKRLEMLKEALPQLTHVSVFWDTHTTDQLRAAEAAAQSLGVQLHAVELHHPPYDFARAIGVAVQEGAQALVVLSSPIFFPQRAQIAALAVEHRLPTIFIFREYVEAGGLMAYGANRQDMYRRAAYYVDRILKGTKPADLPVEQAMKFEFVINLKTAQALGLTMPPHLLILADEVIQ